MNFAGVQSLTIPEGDVRSVAIGGVTVWTKPNPLPYDAEVEYLEATGTQWINAGVTPDGNTAIDSVWTIPSTSSGTLCGGRTSGSEGQFYVWARPNHTNPNMAWRFGYGTTSTYFGPASAYTTPMRVSFGPGYAKFGSAEKTFSSQTFTGTRFYIFALCNGASSSSDLTPLKLHWLKIWQSDVLVRDFLPVRVGTVGYLYDRVSGELFGNAGKGAFVIGPDK